jgi:hypothetical protein
MSIHIVFEGCGILREPERVEPLPDGLHAPPALAGYYTLSPRACDSNRRTSCSWPRGVAQLFR